MNKVLLSLMFLGAISAEAAPFYRIWRGYKKPSLESEIFQKAIQDVFVEATVENGAGYGLQAYIPALTYSNENIKVPDEVALVVYESKEKYEAQRATDIGKAYTELHRQYFASAPVLPEEATPEHISKSIVPSLQLEPIEVIENLKAYDFLGSDKDWQTGTVKIRFFERRKSIDEDLELIKILQQSYVPKSLSYLLLVDEKYFMTYELWESVAALTNSGIDSFIDKNFSEIDSRNQIIAQKTGRDLSGMQNLKLSLGDAVNAQFDKNVQIKYLKKDSLADFVETSLREAYPTLKDYSLDLSMDDGSKITEVYLVKYEDEQGVPVTHEQELSFVFEKSRLHPEQHYFVIENGVEIH